MIINSPHLCTVLEVWSPKYATDTGDWEVWLSCRKVAYASPVILIKFTKAKHLLTQRFCVRRLDVERSERGTNGRIPVFKVPFDKLESWESSQEVYEIIDEAFN